MGFYMLLVVHHILLVLLCLHAREFQNDALFLAQIMLEISFVLTLSHKNKQLNETMSNSPIRRYMSCKGKICVQYSILHFNPLISDTDYLNLNSFSTSVFLSLLQIQ